VVDPLLYMVVVEVVVENLHKDHSITLDQVAVEEVLETLALLVIVMALMV
jgi:hypothetical protein